MYADLIRAALSKSKTPTLHAVDPKLVECWMRLKYGVLDGLGTLTFGREAREGAKMVLGFPSDTAKLASTYEMKPEQIAKALGVSIEQVTEFLKVDLPADDAPFVLRR